MSKCQNFSKTVVNTYVKENFMKTKIWQVWTEKDGEDDTILFEGSKTAAHQYYKSQGGSKAGLHIGYPI